MGEPATLADAKEEIECLKSALKDAEADGRACERLSKGLHDRLPRGASWIVPSAADTALATIDRYKDLLTRSLRKVGGDKVCDCGQGASALHSPECLLSRVLELTELIEKKNCTHGGVFRGETCRRCGQEVR